LGIKANQVTVVGNKNRLRIFIEEDDKFGRLKSLKRALPSVVVKVRPQLSLCRRMRTLRMVILHTILIQQGLPPIIRGIIKLDEKTQDRQLLCEGHALLEVMNTPGK
jgi:hypothetical protein